MIDWHQLFHAGGGGVCKAEEFAVRGAGQAERHSSIADAVGTERADGPVLQEEKPAMAEGQALTFAVY
jgi:hypothetical protein